MKAEKKRLGLYLHIPFCKQKCIYCDFYSLAGGRDRMEAYTQALCAHLAQAAPQAADYRLDTIYVGGGTPSYLGAQRLVRILETVQQHYDVAQEAEITLEANPDSAEEEEDLRLLRRAGFNRISMGMQSACDRELREIGRVHTAEQVACAREAARRAGFENVSLDLIYGLPHQTLQGWQKNLEAAVALAPEHLSCYGLKVEKGTPLYDRKDEMELPDDDAQAEMYLATVELLEQQGYHQYEISNFAKPGRESRHNLKYWSLEEYLGFGPGAHSDFGGLRYAYERDTEGYIRGVRDGTLSCSECMPIPEVERESEWLMLGLRMAAGLDPEGYETRFHRSFDRFIPFLKECEAAGYVRCSQGCWHLTPTGFLVSNPIIGRLLELRSVGAV